MGGQAHPRAGALTLPAGYVADSVTLAYAATVHAGGERIARLMRAEPIVGCHRRARSFANTKHDPAA